MKVPALTAGQMDLQAALRARGMHDVADELLLAAARPQFEAVKIIGTPSVDPPIFGAQYPVDHPYASGKAINLGVTTIASAGNALADLITAGYQWLTVFARLGNATTPALASGDLGLTLLPYEDDNSTLWVPGMAQDFVPVAASLSASIAYVAKRFALYGLDKVRIVISNANAGALQGGTAVYFLQK